MPPYGLYQWPRHYLYGQSSHTPSRQLFNTLASQDKVGTPPAAVIEEAALVVNDLASGGRGMELRQSDKKEKTAARQHKKGESKGQLTSRKALRSVSPRAQSSNDKEDGRDFRVTVQDSNKKRKRHSEVQGDAPTLKRHEHSSGKFVAGTDAWLQSLKSSLGDVTSNFLQPGTLDQNIEDSSRKSKTKHALGNDKVQNITKTRNNELNGGPALSDNPSRQVNRGSKGKKENVLQSRKFIGAGPSHGKAHNARNSASVSKPRNTPIPLPQKSTSHTPTLAVSTPFKSPVPLLHIPTREVASQRTGINAATHGSDVLVSEIPPSQRTSSNAVPPATLNSAPATGETAGRKKKKTVTKNFSTSFNSPIGFKQQASAPATPARMQRGISLPNSQASLTSKNLLRYTEPLNDLQKPRPSGRASSIALSSTCSSGSSDSSMSTKEAFARVQKVQSRSDLEANPFISYKLRKKAHGEIHEEASVIVFNDLFHASRKAVNFTDEAEYLHQHLGWRAQYHAMKMLPCLNKATGCSAKGEQMLRLAREEISDLFKLVVGTEQEQTVFDRAVQNSFEAERLLKNAVIARVPVPLGHLEGIYSLYCPKYSNGHVDKYGFGQRTLSISRPSGFKDDTTYTARLSIPPRSMAYTVLSFEAPPHASFRTTTLTTSAERYKMDIVFLGNGYLQLRVDLGLLLMGKRSESGSGQEVLMELLGVKEKDGKGDEGAVYWIKVEDAVEAEAQTCSSNKLEQSTSGSGKASSSNNNNNKKTKKRGRPSNAELRRREQEAAAWSKQ